MPAREGLGAVAYNGYLYVLGGVSGTSTGDCTSTGDFCKGVFVTGLQSNPRVGYYSDYINIASATTNPNGDVDPIEIVTNGTNVGNPRFRGD